MLDRCRVKVDTEEVRAQITPAMIFSNFEDIHNSWLYCFTNPIFQFYIREFVVFLRFHFTSERDVRI